MPRRFKPAIPRLQHEKGARHLMAFEIKELTEFVELCRTGGKPYGRQWTLENTAPLPVGPVE